MALEKWSGKRGADNIIVLILMFEKMEDVSKDGDKKELSERDTLSVEHQHWHRSTTNFVYDATQMISTATSKMKSMTFYESDIGQDSDLRKSFRTKRTELPAIGTSQIKAKVLPKQTASAILEVDTNEDGEGENVGVSREEMKEVEKDERQGKPVGED